MEDKRIQKTKRTLKQALASLLSRKSLESITVTELCENASTSRITFYTHYDDKYALADDMVSDMVTTCVKDFESLESKTNPLQNPLKTAENVLDAILNLFVHHQPLFTRVGKEESSYMFRQLKEKLLSNVLKQAQKIGQSLPVRIDLKRIAAFICDGMWAFIAESRKQNLSIDTIRREGKELLGRLLSPVLILRPVRT